MQCGFSGGDDQLRNHWYQSAVESPSLSRLDAEGSPKPTATIPCGAKAIVGGRPTMEDAFAVLPDGISAPTASTAGVEQQHDKLSYFAVFDGHGGNEAAQHCAARLHLNLQESLAQCSERCAQQEGPRKSGATPKASSLSLDDTPVALITSQCSCSASGGASCASCASCKGSEHICAALKVAFRQTDAELNGTEIGEVVGSTAVVVLVGASHIYVAHAGDSRAVIMRRGVAHALTADHKPNRKDELARVVAAGGKVLKNGGSHRVMGLLAMSRAIGDHFLRPFIVADPEVCCHPRQTDDEVLLIATDGLWDFFSNQDAMELAMRCLDRAHSRGASLRAACRIAASVLTKAAMERGSRDNITVVLVDLRAYASVAPTPRASNDGQQAAASTAAAGTGSGSSSTVTVEGVPLLRAQGAGQPEALRRSQSQGCAKPLQPPRLLCVPIRRASSHSSVGLSSLAGCTHACSAFELAQRQHRALPAVEPRAAPAPAAPVAGEQAGSSAGMFDPAISLPPVLAPVTPLEVRLGKLRTTTDAGSEESQARQQQQQQQQQPQQQACLAPPCLKLPPKCGPSHANCSSSSSCCSAASQESLPYVPSGLLDPFGSWSSPLLFSQQTAPAPGMQASGGSGRGFDGCGPVLMTNPSAPAACEQVSS